MKLPENCMMRWKSWRRSAGKTDRHRLSMKYCWSSAKPNSWFKHGNMHPKYLQKLYHQTGNKTADIYNLIRGFIALSCCIHHITWKKLKISGWKITEKLLETGSLLKLTAKPTCVFACYEWIYPHNGTATGRKKKMESGRFLEVIVFSRFYLKQ